MGVVLLAFPPDLRTASKAGRGPCQRQRARQLTNEEKDRFRGRAGLPMIHYHDLRHSTIGLTKDTYIHLLPDMQRKAASRRDALFAIEAE